MNKAAAIEAATAPSAIKVTMRALGPDVVIVLLLLFVALGFRAPRMEDSLWLDELHTGWTVSESFADVAPRSRMGNNLPLYFWFLHGVTRQFGMSEFALRLPSLIAGLLAIATAYGIVRRWTDSRIAAVAAACLCMVDREFLFYSVEARPYAMIQWIGLIQIAAFFAWLCPLPSNTLTTKAESDREPFYEGVVWLICTILLFYLHCTSILLPLVQLPIAMFFARSVTNKVRFFLVWCFFIATTSFAVLTLVEVYSRRDAWNEFIGKPTLHQALLEFPLDRYLLVPAIAVAVIGVVSRMLGQSGRQPADMEGVDERSGSRQGFRSDRILPLIALTLTFVLVLAAAFAMTHANIARVFMRRYVIVVSGVPIIVGAILVGLLRTRSLRLLASLILVGVSVYFGPARQLRKQFENQQPRELIHRTEDWRFAVETLNRDAYPGDVVYIMSDLIEADRLHDDKEAAVAEFVSYCSLPLTGFYPLRDDLVVHPLPVRDVGDYVTAKQLPSPDWILSRKNRPDRWKRLIDDSQATVLREKHPTIIRAVVDEATNPELPEGSR